MARLSDALSEWLSRAEVVARGAEGRLRAARRALAEGRASEARSLALALVDELPDSPVVHALWADAALGMQLEREALTALETLTGLLPFRADVWWRRAEIERRLGIDASDALERAAHALEPADAADAARLALAERDLDDRDAERALHWLALLGLGARQSEAAKTCHVRARLEFGDRDGARRAAAQLPLPGPSDGPGWLLRARLLDADDPARGEALRRALMLDAPSADEVALAALDGLTAAEVDGFRVLLTDLGRADEPRWRTALAFLDGPSVGLRALRDVVRDDHDPTLLGMLVERAIAHADEDAIRDAVSVAEARGVQVTPEARALSDALASVTPEARLRALDSAESEFAAKLRAEVFADWLSAGDERLADLLTEASAAATALGAVDLVIALGVLGLETERPVRVAIVGEFNAGKSSLINAILGEAVAPMGVLPTTATLHRLVWAPDRIARIERRDRQADRLVSFSDLGSTLAEIPPEAIDRVTLHSPLELLKRVELTDTPGFNAPNPVHAQGALRAIREAHVALWVLDATQPLKDSERQRLTEVTEQGVPLLVIVNKRDRMEAASLELALAHVTEGLAESGLAAERPVLALSAKQALDADGTVRAGSGIDPVLALMDELSGKLGTELKQRVLLRRLDDLCEQLWERWLVADGGRAEAARAEEEGVVAIAAWVEASRHDPEHQRRWLGCLESALPELVAATLPAASLASDASIEQFLVRRSAEILTPRLSEAFLATLPQAARGQIEESARSAIAAAVAALGPMLCGPERERAMTRLVIVLQELADTLGRGRHRPRKVVAPAWQRRLAALRFALTGRVQTPSAAE